MKTRLLILAAACSAFALSACGSVVKNKNVQGEGAVNNMKVENFSAIEASRGVTVMYSPKGEKGVVIEAPADLMPYVKVSVDHDNTLCCTLADNPFRNTSGKVKIKVGGSMATEFQAMSSAVINVVEPLSAPGKEVEVTCSSSGAVSLNAVCGKLELQASSSGSITVVGDCASAEAAASSSGVVSGELKVSGEFESAASSSGIVNMQVVCNKCEATASSSGAITLSGSAALAKFVASSSGVVSAGSIQVERGSAVASSSGSIVAKFNKVKSMQSSSGGSVRLQ